VDCDINKDAKSYIIKKGDTCESLAKKFKTTVSNLEDLNMSNYIFFVSLCLYIFKICYMLILIYISFIF